MKQLVTIVASFFPLMLAVGCGVSEVPKEAVEKNAMQMLSQSVGKPSPPITCPSGLKAQVGATLTCAMDIDGKTHDVLVAVTKIDGTTANFDINVADKPRS